MNIALGKENRKSWSRDSIHLFNRVTQKGGRMLWNAGIPQKAQNSSGKCPDEGRAQIPTLWCCWNWARGRERRELRLEQVGSWSNPFRWLTRGTAELCNSQKSKPTKTMTSGSLRKKHMATWWVPFLVSVSRTWGLLNRVCLESPTEKVSGSQSPGKTSTVAILLIGCGKMPNKGNKDLNIYCGSQFEPSMGQDYTQVPSVLELQAHTALHDFLHGCGNPNTGSHAYRGKIFTRLSQLSVP